MIFPNREENLEVITFSFLSFRQDVFQASSPKKIIIENAQAKLTICLKEGRKVDYSDP